MRCRRVEHLLSQDPTGALMGRRASAVAVHLRDCPACRRLQEDLVAVEHEVRAIAALHSTPRPDLRRRAIDQHVASLRCAVRSARCAVEKELSYPAPRTAHRALLLRPRLAPPAGAAVVILLLAALGLALMRRGQERTSGPQSLPIAQRLRPRPLDAAPRSATAPGEDERGRRVVVVRTTLSDPPVRVPNRLEPASVRTDAAAQGPTLTTHSGPTDHAADLLMSMSDGTVRGARRWSRLPSTAWQRLEDAVRRDVPVRDDFVGIPFPQVASASDRQIAEAVESYKREAAVVDSRLAREITVEQKASALSDLCDRLRGDTGIHLAAGSSVADEKVTILCDKLPLRDVMRQLSRPFGYTWLRSGKGGEYRYELVQDLRSQLLEEELRNRDRNEALLALEREIQRYRPYLDLSPDEALARSRTTGFAGGAPLPTEKTLLENLASYGWGPIQMYFRLSNPQLVALRAGQALTFSQAPEPGEQPLAPDLARGVLQSWRGWHVRTEGDLPLIYPPDVTHPDNRPLAAVPELRTSVTLTMTQSELGEFSLGGYSRIFFPKAAGNGGGGGPYASGRSPAVLKPDNRAASRKLAGDPLLRPRVTVQLQPSCYPAAATEPSDSSPPEPKVTTADVLEALHRATGLPIVADHYTRLYKPTEVSVRNRSLFEALNHLADTMRLRWRKDADGSWLQFRSASYYDDRLKEVPNRLLSRWAAARRQRGLLSLDDLVEISGLSDAQLDANEMAEGARDCFGLAEWDLARNGNLRPHLRYLATFTPEQRRMAMRTEGLPFTRMSLAQQQQFIAFATLYDTVPSLEDLQGASLRVDYSQPGGFQWGNPDAGMVWAQWVVILEHGPEGRWAPRPMLRGRSREEVMQAVLQLDPEIRERAVHSVRSQRPTPEPDVTPLEAQIYPTKLNLTFLYFPSAFNGLCPYTVSATQSTFQLLN